MPVFALLSHRRLFFFPAVFCALLIVFCELGDTPVAPPGTESIIYNLQITASTSTVSAISGEKSILRATVSDNNGNPVSGKNISFTTTLGTISATGITDSTGSAFAIYSAEPVNGNALVIANMKNGDSTISDTSIITLSGIEITITPDLQSAPVNSTVPYTVRLYDANGTALSGVSVHVMTNKDSLMVTDGSGKIRASVTRTTQGLASIRASALGATDSVSIYFGKAVLIDSVNSNMRIKSYPSNIPAASGEQSKVSVTVFDDNRNPLAGKEVTFTTTLGTISGKAITDSTGTAYATFYSEPVNGNALVTGKMQYSDTVISVSTTITMSGIKVVITPELSSAPLNSIVPVSIKLLDGKGNPLPDNQIHFTNKADSSKVTNGSGEIRTYATSATQGYLQIKAYALGAIDRARIFFGNTVPIDSIITVRSLRLFPSQAQLRADNSAEATITAIIMSEDKHNPLIGDTVEFSSTLGIIDKYGITDSSGRTSVKLRSAPVNGICLIKGVLKSDTKISDSTTVLFSGITLTLSANRNSLKINETSVITALLRDGSGNPISSDIVNFSVTSPGTFANNLKLSQVSLSAMGSASISATSATAGAVTVHAVAANVGDSILLTFTTNNISVAAQKNSIKIGGKDSTLISATYVNQSGTPLVNKAITFATNAGTITNLSSVTNASGVATTYLKSGYFASTATVQAKSADGSAYTTVIFSAATPAQITLSVSPDNIGINGGNAELVATVKDSSGNVVSGAEVSFKITKGPGGSEYIDKPIIATSIDGIARGRLFAGTLPSEYRGCEVEASCGLLSAKSKLTISGEPYSVTVSRPQDDTVTVPKGGILDETTFEYFVGAVVKDVNGNPVADGTPVNFSAVVSGMNVGYLRFVRWETTNGDVKPIIDYNYYDIPFEDINNNYQHDIGIDLDIDANNSIAQRGDDVNGDGKMDYNFITNDFKWPFDNAEPYWPSSIEYNADSSSYKYTIYADLNQNGKWDNSPLSQDVNNNGIYDGPASGDFEYWRWEMRPQFKGVKLDFSNNDFAVVIDRSAVTKDGVAYTKITYPRQFARRLIATVNAEVKGLRDRDGERFVLPVIVQ